MKRCLSALAAILLLALAGGVANAYAGDIGAPALGQENAVQSAPSSAIQPPAGPSQAPAQANNASNEQVSGVLGAANIQTGLNNNTVQAGQEKAAPPVLTTSRAPAVDGNGGNESNGNINTVGDQTAVNGNNFQQSNESTTQPRSGGACCGSRDNESPAGQQNSARNEQASFVAKAVNVQTGLNNNTVQLGSGNESNGNTNTAGDQTAVNGNNFQQSNEQTTAPKGDWKRDDWKRDDCHSGCKNEKPKCGCERSHPENEHNGNINTVGDQTAVNGNNLQQSNESTGSGGSQSNTVGGSSWKKDGCGCHKDGNRQGAIVLGGLNVQTGLNNNTVQLGSGNESNHNTNTVGDQTAVNGNNAQQSNESNGSGGSSPGSQRNEASNHQGAIVLGAANIQTGLNNNTVQIGSGNESNHNTNTVGDQTAVNGNNFQQSNERTSSSKGDWKQGGDWKGDECRSNCEPKPAGQSNHASNHQGAIVIGGLNVQTGLNNNTVQLGHGNESNGNTNTAGDQTAVNGNNFQQSNESNGGPSDKSDGWKKGGDWKGNDCHSSCEPRDCTAKCEPKPKGDDCHSGCKPEPKRCDPKPRCEPKPKCPESKRPEHNSQPANQQNSARNEQGAIVLGGLNVQTGLNNNTVQLGSGNESNHNTNTVGDQTAVNGNNFQQTNTRALA